MNVWQHADGIRENLDRINVRPRLPDHAWLPLQHEIDEHRRAIVRAYATARRWRVTNAYFSLDMLRTGRKQRRRGDSFGREHAVLQHPYWFRVGRVPAAIVVHPYDLDHQATVKWAAARDLVLTVPDDFPSWWDPGWTTLVELRPANQS